MVEIKPFLEYIALAKKRLVFTSTYYLILQCVIVFLVTSAQSILIYAQTPIQEWSRPIDITEGSSATSSLYGIVLCDQYQNTHILWADRTDNGAAIYYRNDFGDKWSPPVDVLASSGNMIRLAGAISNVDDTLHLLWGGNWINGGIYYSKVPLANAENPHAWSTPAPLDEGRSMFGSLAVSLQGIIHVVYNSNNNDYSSPTIYYIRSEDDGLTWSSPVEVFRATVLYPSDARGLLSIDTMGRLHLGVTVRSQEYGMASEVGYIRSVDGGKTWEGYKVVSDQGTAYQGVAVMAPYAFGENEVHLTWHDPRRMHQWSHDGGDTWSEPVEIMSLGAAFGGANALVKDSAGIVHVVTAVNTGVYSASWDGVGWGPKETIEKREFDPHGQEIGLCQGNLVQIVYDGRNDDQKVWYANKRVEAPLYKRQPLPASSPLQPVPTATLTLNPSPKSVVTTEPSVPTSVNKVVVDSNLSSSSANPIMPIIVSVVPVLVILVVIFVFRRR